ncbi:class I SAM-dependent methyltransferase [Burkholderia sp. BE17]|uniref:class I SAM-dependent methyltransferase n=1 Tax=Burkholderia sp. BE17 TaxID=2656644 RepID=UPI00187B9FD1|nr:class I SAM-dependent methyltransferase [Burkholderia sp. BE17]
MTFDEKLFPGVTQANWQMNWSEKIALTGILSRMKPKGALEVGVYHGGSLTLAAPFCDRILAIDIDPDVPNRFEVPPNAEILIAPSAESIPDALARLESLNLPLNYVLIDADHSEAGVKSDIERVLKYHPREPMIMLMHDSGNPGCRNGMLSAHWSSNPYVQWIELDFVPGQIIEHSVSGGHPEVWGGLAMAWFMPEPRKGDPVISQGSRTSVRSAQLFSQAMAETFGRAP